MKTQDGWLSCDHCDSEYKVVSALSNSNIVSYCPFCGSENEDEFLTFDEDYDQ
jgi:hypothetical protein